MPHDDAPRPSLKVLQGELNRPDPADIGAPTGADADRSGDTGDVSGYQPGEIFPACPVTALGVHGETFFYLDILGQLAPVTNHTKDRIAGIFVGRCEMLIAEAPTYDKHGNVSGWSQERIRNAMMRACGDKGVWNAFERVRGLGTWNDPDGGVVMHCGDAILSQGRWMVPGDIDGYVYPSASRIPRPLSEVPAAHESPAHDLVQLLSTWNWVRGDVDAYLLLGWITSAMFGGALKWRPLAWLTGDLGTGKSTLQELMHAVMGGKGAVLQSTDATEAGIRQQLMNSTLPVALDEIEAEAKNDKVKSIVKLARQAASGGVVLRGGADHKGQEFTARSCFVFSSVLVPPLLDQDISRIALLELMPLEKGAVPPEINPKHWGQCGRAMRARVLDQWPRLHETREHYRLALTAEGHSSRGCDQFGTLLAMADLVLHDTPDPARCAQWAAKISAEMIEAQTDSSSDWQRMLNHLFGQPLDTFRSGERLTVGRWVMIAAGLADDQDEKKAERALRSVGLRVYGRKAESAQLAIANNHVGLDALFTDTHWARGVWKQAAKRIPGSTATGVLRFDMVASRAAKFPLRAVPHILGDKDMPEAAQPPEAPQNKPEPDLDDFL